MIAPLLLYMGVLTTKHICRDWDCRLLTKYKGRSCPISVDGNTATLWGGHYSMKRVTYGRTTIWEGRDHNYILTMFFRPSDKILRAYLEIQKEDGRYLKFTCEFGRSNEGDWK